MSEAALGRIEAGINGGGGGNRTRLQAAQVTEKKEVF